MKYRISETDINYPLEGLYAHNPVMGCTKVCAVGDECFALKASKMREDRPGWPMDFRQPELFRARMEPAFPAKCKNVLVGFMSDVADWHNIEFEPGKSVFQREVEIIEKHDKIRFFMLTKRPAQAYKTLACMFQLPNLWLGITATDIIEYQDRMNVMGDYDFRENVWVSAEPWRGPAPQVTANYGQTSPSWVVLGGQSGGRGEPLAHDVAALTRDRCERVNIPFLFKQWGKGATEGNSIENGFPLLDGRTHLEVPA